MVAASFAQAYDLLPDPLAILDAHDRVAYLNAAWRQGLANPDQALGAPIEELLAPFLQADLLAASGLVAILAAARASAQPQRIHAVSNTGRLYRLTVAPIDAQLLVQYHALEVEAIDLNLQRILEELPVGVFVIDAQGQPCYANLMAEQILGKGAVALDGMGLAAAYQAYRADTDELYPHAELPLIRALAGQPQSASDIAIQRPDGRLRLKVDAVPLIGSDGQVRYAIATFAAIES